MSDQNPSLHGEPGAAWDSLSPERDPVPMITERPTLHDSTICRKCGALVGHLDLHNDWHAANRVVLRPARWNVIRS